MQVAFIDVAPGLMVFAGLMLATYTATSLAREVETRSLARYRVAGRSLGAVLAGNGAAHLVLAVLAFGLMLAVATLLGLRPEGSVGAMFLVMAASSLAVMGLGMLVAALVRRREDATSLSLLLLLPLGFLSGAFFPLPAVRLATLGGHTWTLYELLPVTHAVAALEAIMDGASLGNLGFELASLLVLGAVWLAAGAGAFWIRGARTAL